METQHRIIFADSRDMRELKDGSVHLVVTSPPYPMIEMWDGLFRRLDPGVDDLWRRMEPARGSEQVKLAKEGYDRMHEVLAEVWGECLRVLCEGGLLCANVGDATRSFDGIFRLYPNHARVIELCEGLGFMTLPYLFWRKPTNRPNAFLGSGFLPTNGYVTLDLEQILIFRKGGPRRLPARDTRRYASRFTKAERDVWFSQTWILRGVTQKEDGMARRTAAFPLEIARRLIRMFSILGDTVLDPFLGTGTTMEAARMLGRNCVGYEVDAELRGRLERRLGEGVEFLARSSG